MYRLRPILPKRRGFIELALTGLMALWLLPPAAAASENDSAAALIRAARPMLRNPESTDAGVQAIASALAKVDLQSESDRDALSALANDLALPTSDVDGISQLVLRGLAHKDASASDALVDRYSRILARYLSRSYNIATGFGDEHSLAQFLIIAGDGERQRRDFRFAALLYEKAIVWGADQQTFNSHVRDLTPTRTKLADCFARLGRQGGEGLESDGARQVSAPFIMNCAPDSNVKLARLLASAQRALARRDARASVQHLETIKSQILLCKDVDVDRDLLFSTALAVLGRAYWAMDDTVSAIRAFHDFADSYEQLLDRTLLALSENMARVPYLSMSESVDTALSFLAGRMELEARDIALQLLASRVGRLPEMQGDRSRRYRHAGAGGVQLLRWQATRATLLLRGNAPAYQALIPDAKLPHDLSSPPGTTAVMEAIGELEFAEDQLGRALMEHHASGSSIEPVSTARIQAAVPPGTTILLYALVPRVDPWRGSIEAAAEYVRWTLTSGGIGAPARVGTSNEIDNRVERYVQQLDRPGGVGFIDGRSSRIDERGASRSGRTRQTSIPSASELSALLLPSAADLLMTNALGVIADGSLFHLPFAALVGEDGRPIISRMSVFNVLGPRSLARRMTPGRESGESLRSTLPVLLGDPLDHTSSPWLHAPDATPLTLTEDFGALPGAREEIKSIARILGGNVSLLIGADATESAVKSLRAPVVLHLATHGHYLTSNDPILNVFELSRTTPSGLGANAPRVANPWMHAYLALAEYSALQPLDRDDGVLTDIEVLGLDLDGTLLAVASACESGIGPIETGSGIYSLRTAFAMAGAKSQVVSLWEVNDLGAQAFMEEFYNRLHGGASTLDAFADTQRALASGSRFADPYYWAAFTISGDNVVIWKTASK